MDQAQKRSADRGSIEPGDDGSTRNLFVVHALLQT
jgi:hypothetical protein